MFNAEHTTDYTQSRVVECEETAYQIASLVNSMLPAHKKVNFKYEKDYGLVETDTKTLVVCNFGRNDGRSENILCAVASVLEYLICKINDVRIEEILATFNTQTKEETDYD